MHVHANEEHRCEICGFVSSSKPAKKRHIDFKHNPEKKHKCTMCEKAFKTPTLLKEHMATHTGIDLYKCAYCDATFKSKSNRSTHYRRHHPVEYNANMIRRSRPTAIENYTTTTA
ncbi:zinc finger X-chromosomal protein-like [Musca autumnalis]|uniref:zinc finger X-chromosomal protein-like n=1 Tax=Musca autumnalis TaxID=221902 RepID=UPI003CF47DB2